MVRRQIQWKRPLPLSSSLLSSGDAALPETDPASIAPHDTFNDLLASS
ncbi:hypothetical protein QEH56_07045 [Pelagicoccus enzymogenes]|nr:hypothetical protein [Pelagicoccus enzymogenes]MDQ8197896.1 hypothetical protein [Pelagicoccus enzymogenes]